jgi:hypothetical protein
LEARDLSKAVSDFAKRRILFDVNTNEARFVRDVVIRGRESGGGGSASSAGPGSHECSGQEFHNGCFDELGNLGCDEYHGQVVAGTIGDCQSFSIKARVPDGIGCEWVVGDESGGDGI